MSALYTLKHLEDVASGPASGDSMRQIVTRQTKEADTSFGLYTYAPALCYLCGADSGHFLKKWFGAFNLSSMAEYVCPACDARKDEGQ